MTIEHIVLMPRWGGGPESDFYPWLTEQLGDGITVHALSHVNPGAPRIDESVATIHDALSALPLERTLLLGHSIGVHGLLHALAELPKDAGSVPALLAVAGWWGVDSPWETIQPWVKNLPDTEAARATCERFELILSDNDPYTADYEANAARWREHFDATIHLIPGARHFNAEAEPAVLERVRAIISG